MNTHPWRRWHIPGCLAAVALLVAGCTSAASEGPTSPSSSTPVTATPSVADVSPNVSPSPASSGDGPSPSTGATSQTGTAGTVDPAAREIADRAAVEKTWDDFWTVALGVVRMPDDERKAALAAVAVDPLRTQILNEARDASAKGLDRYGAMTAHPYWQQRVDGQSTAVMGDCQDSSKSGTVETASGQNKTVGVADNNIRATFVRTDDGQWKVQDVYYLVDVQC